jgi:hypothetical protein
MRDSVNSAIVQVIKVTSTGLTAWGREAAVNLGAHYRRRYFLPVSLEAAAETFSEGLRGAEASRQGARLLDPQMQEKS